MTVTLHPPRTHRWRPLAFSHPSATGAPAPSPWPALPTRPLAAAVCGRRVLPWASRLWQGDVECAVMAAASWLHPGRRSRRHSAAFRDDLRVGGICRRPDAALTVRATDNVVNKCANRTCASRHTTTVLLQRGMVRRNGRGGFTCVIRAADSRWPPKNDGSPYPDACAGTGANRASRKMAHCQCNDNVGRRGRFRYRPVD